MQTAVIYGSTGTGKNVYLKVKDKYNVLYFVDENLARIGKRVEGLEIRRRKDILKFKPDIVILGQLTGYIEAEEWLVKNGFPEEKIISKFVDLPFRARQNCLEKIEVIYQEKKIEGSVAELGVYRGDFARVINGIFSDRKLYLFDTFEGFSDEDLNFEIEHDLLTNEIGKFSNTSVDYVLNKMPYRQNCIIRKGYFPETAIGLEEECFAFVNIDVDLYKPIIAGLEWFWPRLVSGGVYFCARLLFIFIYGS